MNVTKWVQVLVVFAIVFDCFCMAKVGFVAKKCKVIPLKARPFIKAETIFSGTVKSFLIPRSDIKRTKRRTFGAKVKIKRVYRGNQDLQGQTVVVDGLGNPNICVSRPKPKDTKVFFVDSTARKHRFRLRSSLLRLTLSNLKALWLIARNEAGKCLG